MTAGLIRLAGSVSLAALLAGSGALAQTLDAPAEGEDFALDPIIVRGELQERAIQDTPTSVVVVTGEDLERRSDPDLYTTIERIPNVAHTNGGQGFSIRGIDQRGVGGGGTAQVVSVQVDGVALPSNQATFYGPYSTWDLQQVEVLRGPQSTQQGRNALAGAIVIRSNDPTYEQEAKLRLEYGQRDTYRGAVMLNTPIIEDKLAFRFSGEIYHTDGWIENPTLGTDDYDSQDLRTARAKLRWDPTEDVEVILSFTRSKNEGGEDIIFESDENWPDNRDNFADVEAKESSDHDIWGLRANWAINEILTLESETNYYKSDYVRIEDTDYTAEPLGVFSREGTSESFEQDLRLRFDTASVRGVVGLFYAKTDNDNPSTQVADLSTVNRLIPEGYPTFPDGFGTFSRIFGFGSKSENFALYGEGDFDIGAVPGLTVTAGLRYDREKVTETRQEKTRTDPAVEDMPFPYNLIGEAIVPEDSDTENTRSFDALLPKLGVTYDWSQDVATSFTVQRGYRAGGSYTNGYTGQSQEFDPEFVWNYEFAFRGQFLDGRLTTNANIFYMDWQDQQVSVRGDSGNPLDQDVINAGKSRVYGAELFVGAAMTSALDLFASVGYSKSEFLDFESGGVDYAGNRFPNAPELTGALGGTYYFDNGLSLSADASYTGGSYSDTSNDSRSKSDDRWLLNAQLAYETGGLTAALYVRNLLDEDYATYRYYSEAEDVSLVRVGEPRTVGAFVQWEY